MDQIDVRTFAALAHPSLIDVREPDEFGDEHVPGAVNLPLGDLAERLDSLPEGRPVYAICQSGRRSAQAVELLERHGIDAVNVAGGTNAWKDAELPLDHE